MNTLPSLPPSPIPVPDVPHEEQPEEESSKKKFWIIGGIVLFIVLVVLATIYSSFLGAKVAPGKKFKILGPSTVRAGETATITWDTSPENVKRYPYEKIEYCYGKALKQKCILLVASAPNNGKATVKIPASLPVGKGVFKFTARDPQKKLFATLVSSSGPVTVQPVQTTSETNSGSGGGGSGGGSGGGGGDSGGGGGNDPSPTPVQKVTTTINSLCVDNSDREVHTNWSSQQVFAKHRKVGETEWRTSSTNAYSDHENNIRVALLFNAYTYPPYSVDQRLQTNEEFEIQLYPGQGYPNGSQVQPSDIYRFKTPDFTGKAFYECVSASP